MLLRGWELLHSEGFAEVSASGTWHDPRSFYCSGAGGHQNPSEARTDGKRSEVQPIFVLQSQYESN